MPFLSCLLYTSAIELNFDLELFSLSLETFLVPAFGFRKSSLVFLGGHGGGQQYYVAVFPLEVAAVTAMSTAFLLSIAQ